MEHELGDGEKLVKTKKSANNQKKYTINDSPLKEEGFNEYKKIVNTLNPPKKLTAEELVEQKGLKQSGDNSPMKFSLSENKNHVKKKPFRKSDFSPTKSSDGENVHFTIENSSSRDQESSVKSMSENNHDKTNRRNNLVGDLSRRIAKLVLNGDVSKLSELEQYLGDPLMDSVDGDVLAVAFVFFVRNNMPTQAKRILRFKNFNQINGDALDLVLKALSKITKGGFKDLEKEVLGLQDLNKSEASKENNVDEKAVHVIKDFAKGLKAPSKNLGEEKAEENIAILLNSNKIRGSSHLKSSRLKSRNSESRGSLSSEVSTRSPAHNSISDQSQPKSGSLRNDAKYSLTTDPFEDLLPCETKTDQNDSRNVVRDMPIEGFTLEKKIGNELKSNELYLRACELVIELNSIPQAGAKEKRRISFEIDPDPRTIMDGVFTEGFSIIAKNLDNYANKSSNYSRSKLTSNMVKKINWIDGVDCAKEDLGIRQRASVRDDEVIVGCSKRNRSKENGKAVEILFSNNSIAKISDLGDCTIDDLFTTISRGFKAAIIKPKNIPGNEIRPVSQKGLAKKGELLGVTPTGL
jgi:hypothetical protein